MKWTLWIACLITTFATTAVAADKPQAKRLSRILLVTGRDVPAHPWRETTPALREALEKTGKFEVLVSEEPAVLESSALASYDVILLNYYNWERPEITDQAKENLLKFVKSGKGLVSFHFSVRAWGKWAEYRKLIGRIWVDSSGHGPRGTFKVKVADADHYITQGLTDFEADDELYAKLIGDTPINVLVEAYSEWSKKTEPIAWTLDYGQGRVFNIVLGHDAKACRLPQFVQLLQRGTVWAGRLDGQTENPSQAK
ncbi:MAG TPA: ThuA domain-containing protein [Phycisphaerae bacterium]|nr:ThuA domain-containing protein [Phycisphaerae bacterium]HRY68159.1 ThuA domain-containing protein [Phycisphaerae bacterium]HSA27055.1 ThuA domain-containing protein [Phycisphaerae bacterium]